jgi:HK97 gp10 family phage protein
MARSLATPKNKLAVAVGLPELQKRIADLINAVDGKSAGREVKKVWMRAALVVRDEARSRAPLIKSDPAHPKKWQAPGILKKAIFAAYGKDTAPNVIVGVNYGMAPQAHWIEFGTAERQTGDMKGKSTGKHAANRGSVPPQPYMRPALAAARAQAIEIMAAGYRDLIEANAK